MAETKENSVNYMFDGTLDPIDISKFTLFRGVTDYTNLLQFDLYETGYSYLICLQIPTFLQQLQARNDKYKQLIQNYRHIIEWEFKGISGLEDITSETAEINNGITSVSLITRTREQGGSSFTMNYLERSGSILTKVNELYLRGIKDPKTQTKRYNGLLSQPFQRGSLIVNDKIDPTSKNGSNHPMQAAMFDAGFQYEIFHFLLIITDNTRLNVEKAYILASCQPTTANTSIYNTNAGEIQFSEIPITMNGIPLPGKVVTAKAQNFLKYINQHVCFDEMEYGYSVLDESVYTEVGEAFGKDDGATGDTYYDKIENSNSAGTELYSDLIDDLQTAKNYEPTARNKRGGDTSGTEVYKRYKEMATQNNNG